MSILGNITEIAASSSDLVWAVDTDTNTVYRRNIVTKDFEKVPVNITVASLDISADGYVIALDADGYLHVWNPAEGIFEPRIDDMQFDAVSIGDTALWAREADTGTLHIWDDDSGEFVDALFPGTAVDAFVAAKVDDAFYVVDDSDTLWQYGYPPPPTPGEPQDPGTWTRITEELGVDDVAALVAMREEDLWAIDTNGEVYQLNTLNLEDQDAPQITFVPQSEALGLDPLSDFALDESGILYGVSDDTLSVTQTESAAVQTYLGDQTSAVALGTDSLGRTHYVYSTEGGVYHSYLSQGGYQRAGEFINAQFIPDSGAASEVKVDFDADGNVYISWIEAAGNVSEVYVAKGVKNSGFEGYTFSKPQQVTDDDVSDRDLDMHVADDGQITLSVTKQDALNRFDDADIYQYSIDGSGTLFERPPEFGVTEFNEDGKFVAIEPLNQFLGGEPGLGAYGVSATFPMTLGFAYKSPGQAVDVKFFVKGNVDTRSGFTETSVNYTFVAGLNAAAWIPSKFVKDLKFSILSNGSLGTFGFPLGETPVTESLINAGFRFNLDLDFLGPYSPDIPQSDEALAKGYKPVPTTTGGVFAQFDYLWVVTSKSDNSQLGGQNGSFNIPIEFVDQAGQPINENTPPSDIRAAFSMTDLAKFAVAAAVPNLFGQDGTTPDPDTNALNDVKAQQQALFAGFFFGSNWLGIGFNARVGAQIGTQGLWGSDRFFTEIGARSFGELTVKPWFYGRLWDFRIGHKFDADAFAASPVFGEFNVGGTTNLYDDGLVVKTDGTDDGESDILSNDEFDYVFLSDDRVVGVYVQAEIDQSDGSLSAINTIDGDYNPDTGEIEWDLDSIVEVPGSKGFNFDPRIALGGDEDNPRLFITWANVPIDDDDLEAVIDTPPGKAYVIFGGDVSNEKIELSELRNGPLPILARDFYYTSAEGGTFFGIGTSAELLGDINTGTGQTDFIIGAPDAVQESGKAYIVFGEDYRQVRNLDDGSNGTSAFSILGERDSELGYAVSTAGDFDGNGIPDIAIAAPGADNHTGAVYVIYGGQDWSQVGGEGNPGQFNVDDIGGVLDGVKLSGPAEGARWGTAISGGYDVTGSGADDLAVGSVQTGTITIVSDGEDPITIELDGDVDADINPDNYGLGDIGGAVAMLEDINADGNADLLIGDTDGSAYVMFGGEDFHHYARNYVVSWAAEGDGINAPDYQTLLSFNGEDLNGDGIISGFDASQPGFESELTNFRIEVFQDDSLVYSYDFDLTNEAVDFNYEIATGQVLVNTGPAETNLEQELYGLSVYPIVTPNYSVGSAGGVIQEIQLRQFNVGPIATAPLGSSVFATLSTPDSFDLQYLTNYPQSGFIIASETPLPLQVSEAGDVDGDGLQDFIVGFDQSQNEEGGSLNGNSYVVFGDADLTTWSGIINLNELDPDQAYRIELAGGQVSSAGDVNGDGVGDLLISAPNDDSLAELSGKSWVIYGSEDIRNANFVAETGFILENKTEFERSGASLTSLGDLNGDGFDDFLLGAPQSVDSDLAQEIADDAEILYSVRDPDNSDPIWTVGTPVDTANDTTPPEAPLALAQTSEGMLAAWVSQRTDAEGNTLSTLYTAFYDGTSWSTPEAVGPETSNLIGEATITDVEVTKSLSRPMIIWVESDIELNQTTTVYQSQYDDGWEDPTPVTPIDADAPSPAGYNYITNNVLVVGDESLTVADVHVDEPETGSTFATFIVTREGDTSEASGPYDFRLKDYSATFGLDFAGVHTGTFSFEAGQTIKEITVEIFADDLFERTESLRLEISSQDETAYVSDNGLAVPDATSLTASLFVDDADNNVLNLTSIDSGFKLNGEQDVALGYALSAAGHLNGDNIDDFMIAAPTAGTDNEGKAYVVYGQRGIAISLQEQNLDTLDASQGAILTGETPDGQAGSSLAYGQSGAQPFIVVGAPGDADTTGAVYVVPPSKLAGTGNDPNDPNEVVLNDENALKLTIAGPNTDDGDYFGRVVTVADLNNVGGNDDLVVTSGDAVYVVYDILSQGLTGSYTLDPQTTPFEVSKIVNLGGEGFGNGLAVTDFDGDGNNDLIVGVASGNTLVDQYGLEQGDGGFVAVIRGSATGLATDQDINVNNLGDQGFRFLGQASFTPVDGDPVGDPNNPGAIAGNNGPLSGTPLLDGVGDAIAAVDLDGDGLRDLVIGAPEASIADPDGQQSFSGTSAGRVYVLFAGDDPESGRNWSTLEGNYQLLDLYGANPGQPGRYQDGIILEGTEAGAYAGSSLANVGFFRGGAEQGFNIEDLGIGAPGANGGAGQAYIVFGSQLNFTGITRAGDNVFSIQPIVNPGDYNALPVFTYQGPAALLDNANPINEASVGFAVAGYGDIDAEIFGTTGGTEFGIGAPFIDVNGVGQTYIATGHPWIAPGQSLDVEDLRADNGFILEGSGATIPVGDFDGDGYDDYLLQDGDSLTLVLGASTFDIEASLDREIALDIGEGLADKRYVAGDFNGDGRTEIAAILEQGTGYTTVLYTADALADPDTTTLSPIPVTAPSALADIEGAVFSAMIGQGQLLSADLNGDGFDDLLFVFERDTSGFFYALGTEDLGVFGDVVFNQNDYFNGLPLGIADLNGDGRDEIVVSNNNTDPVTGDARILSWDDSTQNIAVAVPDFDWAALVDRNPFAFDRQNIYLSSSAGDVNGDGYEDFVISFRGARDVSPAQVRSSSVLVYGAEEFADISGTVLRPSFGVSDGVNPDPIIDRVFADIIGDMNGDGFDDVLVSQTSPTAPDGVSGGFSYVVFGGDDLPSEIVLPTPETIPFEYGIEIRGFNNRGDGLPYLVSKAGDVNGDGLADYILSDDSVPDFDLTFTIYGERQDAPGSGAAISAADVQTEIIDGTSDNDYIVQSGSGGIASILAMEGDDVVLTSRDTQILAYLGEGNDTIGIADVDTSSFLRIDGGNGFDTLFFNTGKLNTLDLTKAEMNGKISGFEMIDLGVQNGLTLDVVTLKELTGSGNTLLVRGEDAKLNLKREPDGSWEKVGTNAHDGVVYDVYQFVFEDQFQFDDAPTSNFSIWVEQGGVLFNDLQAGTDGRDKLRGTRDDDNIFGDGGRDFIFGRRGNDSLDGGDDRDFLFGGSGDDELRGGPDGDILKGGPGADTFIGSAEDFVGDRIIGFGKHDQIIVEGFDFNDIAVEKSCFGRIEILFDLDADGEFDGSLLVKRLFGPRSFDVEQVNGDVVISLESQDRFGGYLSSIFERLFDGWDYG